MLFVAFQQAVICDRLEKTTQEELSKAREFVDTRLKEDLVSHEQPWNILEGELEPEKKMKYLAAYVSFPHRRAVADVYCIIVKSNRF